jgi:twinkle protein
MQVDPEDPDNDIRLLRILKNRFTGETGDAGTMVYDRETGRLLEEELAALMQPQDEEEESEEHDSNETDDLTVH